MVYTEQSLSFYLRACMSMPMMLDAHQGPYYHNTLNCLMRHVNAIKTNKFMFHLIENPCPAFTNPYALHHFLLQQQY